MSQVSLPDLAEFRWTPKNRALENKNISDWSGEMLRTGNVSQQMGIYSMQTVRQKTGFRMLITYVPDGLAGNYCSIESLKLSLFKKLNMTYVHQQVPRFYDGGVVPVCGVTRPSVTNLYWLANTDFLCCSSLQLSFWDQHREIHEAPGEQGHLIGAQHDPTGQ